MSPDVLATSGAAYISGLYRVSPWSGDKCCAEDRLLWLRPRTQMQRIKASPLYRDQSPTEINNNINSISVLSDYNVTMLTTN